MQAGLIGDDGSAALVWMRLTGVAESGHLVAELLNNPFAKHGCAPDDLMALGVAEDDEGTLRLFAHDAMADESWDQRAWVSALFQCRFAKKKTGDNVSGLVILGGRYKI